MSEKAIPAAPPVNEKATYQAPLGPPPAFEGIPQQQVPIQQQPAPVPSMVQGVNPRNAHNLEYVHDGRRKWSHGFCSCCDEPGQCLIAWCLPCMSYGEIEARMVALDTTGRPDAKGGDSCNSSCLAWCLISYFTAGIGGVVLSCVQRGKVRDRYNIGGGGASDCCSNYCCHPCALVQTNREIMLEESVLLGKWDPSAHAIKKA